MVTTTATPTSSQDAPATQDGATIDPARHETSAVVEQDGPEDQGGLVTGNPWVTNAEALADWTMARVVVRKDVFGVTLPDGKRITAHKPLTKELLIRHYQGLERQ